MYSSFSLLSGNNVLLSLINEYKKNEEKARKKKSELTLILSFFTFFFGSLARCFFPSHFCFMLKYKLISDKILYFIYSLFILAPRLSIFCEKCAKQQTVYYMIIS